MIIPEMKKLQDLASTDIASYLPGLIQLLNQRKEYAQFFLKQPDKMDEDLENVKSALRITEDQIKQLIQIS